LLEPSAAASLREVGWDNVESIPVLWALSRAPDADLALSTLMRLRESIADGWDAIDSAIRTDSSLRGRLFALLGSSSALGDHLVAAPSAWEVLRRKELPDRDELIADLLAVVEAEPAQGPRATEAASQRDSIGGGGREAGELLFRAGLSGPDVVASLRKRYRDQWWAVTSPTWPMPP
jgi:glutamate-ammonia-ligase adenylyltransferase